MTNDVLTGLSSFSVQERINDCSNTITFEYSGFEMPDVFKYQNDMSFVLYDKKQPKGYIGVSGKALLLEPSVRDGKGLYKITGRTDGDLLVNQPFNLDCVDGGVQNLSSDQILKMILTDTNIKVARGQAFNSNVSYNNNSQDVLRYCGAFETKKDAIDQLFLQYQKKSGSNKIRWFIDLGGNLRWIELRGNRTRPHQLNLNDRYITDYVPSRDAMSIKNDITLRAGDQGSIVSHAEDSKSINGFYDSDGHWNAGYGRRIEQMQDGNITTQEEADRKVREELAQKSMPIYTVKLEYLGYYPGMVGESYNFLGDSFIHGKTFVLVEKNINGNPADWKTNLTFTTDESAYAIANMFETIQAIAEKVVEDNKSEEGVVVAVPAESPRITVLMTRSNTTESVKYIEKDAWGSPNSLGG